MRVLKDRVIWDAEDFMTFLPQQQSSSVRLLGKGAVFMRDIDPFGTIPGALYPGSSPVDVTNVSVVDAALVDGVVTAGGVNAYLIGGSKLHQLDVTSNTITNAGAWPHTIAAGAATHSGHTGIDTAICSVAQYNIAGVTKLFYSWNDATDWDVGMYDLVSAFDDDYMSTVPTTPLGTTAADLTGGLGKVHALYASKNDALLYISSGRYAHAFDGATTTFQSKVFTAEAGYEIVGFAETGYDLVLFKTTNARTGRRGIAVASFYGADRSADPYKHASLDDDEVSAPFSFKSTVGCFTRNRNSGRSVLRLYDGENFLPMFYFSGSLPTLGGVEIQDNLIKWNSDGVIYAYGKKDADFDETKFQPFRTLGSTSGVLKSFLAGTLYASGGTTTAGGLQTFNTGSYSASAFWQGKTAFPKFPMGYKGWVKNVKVQYAKSASGGRSLEFQIHCNGTLKTVFSGVTAVTGASLLKQYFRDSSGNNFPTFTSIKPVAIWDTGSGSSDAPGIVSMEVEFGIINNFTL